MAYRKIVVFMMIVNPWYLYSAYNYISRRCTCIRNS